MTPTMTRTTRLLALLIVAGATAAGSGVALAQAPLTLATPAEVPAVVAIARPTAEEIDIARSSFAKFVRKSDRKTQAILSKYPSLLEVRPPGPNSAVLPSLAPGFVAKHQANLAVAKQGDAELLFMGDSITDFWRNPEGNYAGKPVMDKHFGQWKIANYGIAGDTTQGVLYRLEDGEGAGINPRAIMLMIGTNNTARNSAAEIAEGVGAVVLSLQRHYPRAQILLLGIFPRGRANDPLRGMIADINRSISRLDDGKQVHYLDIGAGFLESDGSISPTVMSDGLHPTTKGYEIWAQAVEQPLTRLMGAAK
jgi:lysophospholipase L1-like esterase